MGKNRSGSLSRQAARDSQLAELASAAAVGTDITGSLSLIACGTPGGKHRRGGV